MLQRISETLTLSFKFMPGRNNPEFETPAA
jgi:hypothetical protein